MIGSILTLFVANITKIGNYITWFAGKNGGIAVNIVKFGCNLAKIDSKVVEIVSKVG